MNILVLKEYNGGKVIYEYQPEGQGAAGVVQFDVFGMNGMLVKKAEGDSESETYGYKALSKIEDLVKKNNIPLKFTQAWY